MKITINGKQYDAEANETILEVCLRNGIDVPYLCYHPDLHPEGKCRMCIVDVDGHIKTSCNTAVHENATIITDNEKINGYRKLLLELMLEGAPKDMAEDDNRVMRLVKKYGAKVNFSDHRTVEIDDSSPSIVIDKSRCVLCGRCVQKCQLIQEVYALGYEGRGINTEVGPYHDHELNDVVCTFCGQCSLVCPSGAIKEHDYIAQVKAAIADPTKHVVVQPAPAVRVALGETQGMEPGSEVTGQMWAALRRLGFDKVFDTNFAADLTILEEGTELVKRIQENGVLPMITSCSPGWIKFIEHLYPELLPHLSTCKSPHQMLGALAKTYYADRAGIDPKDIVCVSIMPCTAKKFECNRPEMQDSGFQDVDYVLTTRELGRWIKQEGLDFQKLPEEGCDSILGAYSGAGAIFGATGGVMEAALRFAADVLEGKSLENIEYKAVRGLEGIKEAAVTIGGMEIRVAVGHGLSNAHKLLKIVVEEPSKYHFIEVMACPGGCIAGGGQPQPTTREIWKKRAKAIYGHDEALTFRKSQDNPELKKLYEDFLGEPGGHRSHELLHTHYTSRQKI